MNANWTSTKESKLTASRMRPTTSTGHRRRGSAGPVRVAHNLREPPGHLQGLQGLRDRRVPSQGEERSATERPRGVGVGGAAAAVTAGCATTNAAAGGPKTR